MPYGRYTLRLEAKKYSDLDTEELIELPILLQTPFYYKWWFLLSIFFCNTLGIFSWMKKREMNLTRSKQKLEKELKKRINTINLQAQALKKLKEVESTIEAQTHPHRILNDIEKENEFIIALKSYITNNLEDLSLNGDSIGKEFGMSRMKLHRKLKETINYSTREYIRSVRLEVAHQLLLQKKHNISEIAYQTGFSSPSYFSRAFKKEFGKVPSEELS